MSPLVYSSVCADVERFNFGVLNVTFMTLIVLFILIQRFPPAPSSVRIRRHIT